jgi:polyphosphate kinase
MMAALRKSADETPASTEAPSRDGKLKRKDYEKELRKLQVELCRLQDWVTPALPAPSERQKTQMFAQRYIEQFPAAGEVVVFDRSWYNRAGVERVMDFIDERQHRRFLALCPEIEKNIVDGGIKLIKIWLEVGKDEQERRFTARINDPVRRWKLSPMDLESYPRWYEYSQARDRMFEMTDTIKAPWYIVHSDDKRRARLNCIAHILSLIPYKKVPRAKVKLPKRTNKHRYDDQASLKGRRFAAERY